MRRCKKCKRAGRFGFVECRYRVGAKVRVWYVCADERACKMRAGRRRIPGARPGLAAAVAKVRAAFNFAREV